MKVPNFRVGGKQMNKQEAIEKIEKLDEHYGISQGVYLKKRDVVNIISQIDEPQKVVVPKFVAEWVGYCKFNRLKLLGAFDPVSELGVGLVTSLTEELRKGKDWAQRNQETFARAWLAYPNITVEQEKLYTVEIPDPHGMYKIRYLFKNGMGNIRIGGNDYRDIFLNGDTHLTEAEIRKDFEWAWDAGFAKEVE